MAARPERLSGARGGMARRTTSKGVSEASGRVASLGEPLSDLFATTPTDPPPLGTEGHRHRMRARLLVAGPEALADHEMLEMLLFLALPRRDTKPMARELLRRFGGFGPVVTASPDELRAVDGLGDAGVAALKLAQAAALRLLRGDLAARPVLKSWELLTDYLRAALRHEKIEQFRVLFLDARSRLIADEVMGRGTINHAPVYPREIARRALELHASTVLLVHNHPSGSAVASRDDIAMTREVGRALQPLGILLHDHLIIAGDACVSFRREGLMP
jgi:DNA repair protein RadC